MVEIRFDEKEEEIFQLGEKKNAMVRVAEELVVVRFQR
jgi:hypothetical protein